MAKTALKSKATPQLPATLVAELERRRAGMARHMARAVVTQPAVSNSRYTRAMVPAARPRSRDS